MKKLIKTVAVLMAAALAVGSLASCKMNAELGDNWKPWKVDSTDRNEKNARTIIFENDSTKPIEWWCWTDEKGQILEDTNLNPTDINSRKINANGGKQEFKFKNNETYKLNIYVADEELQAKAGKGREGFNKDNADTYLDFRGKVTPHSKYGKVIKTSGFGQGVTKQGEFWFTNDEPNSGSFFYESDGDNCTGDYTVEEVWVLEQKENDYEAHGKTPNKPNENSNTDTPPKDHTGAKYTAREDLKYKKLAIKTGNAGFLVPVVDKVTGATKQVVVALEQPKRAEKGANKKLNYFKYKDNTLEIYDGYKADNKTPNVIKTNTKYTETTIPKTFTGDDGKNYTLANCKKIKITSKQLSEKKQEYWGKRVTLAPHAKAVAVNSSDMDDVKFDRYGYTNDFTNLNGKSALGIETVVVVPGIHGEK